MSDAFGYIVKVVLGQYIDKKSHMIYYANYILNDAQINYTMNKKECYVQLWFLLLRNLDLI